MNEIELAEQHLQAGRYKKAEALFAELCERFPNWPRVYIGYARSLTAKNQLPLQLDAWRQAVAKFPKSEQALAGLVACLGKTGPQALPELLRLRNEDVALDEVEKGLGQLALAEERLADAVVHFQRVLRLKPQRPWVRLNLIETLLKLKRHEEAVTEGLVTLEDAPVAKVAPYAQLVSSALACSRTRDAGKMLLGYVKRVPDAVSITNALPVLRAFARSNATQALLESLEPWAESQAQDPDAGWLWVRALRIAGFDRRAAEVCTQLRDQFPERADFRLETAKLLTVIQDWAEAYAAWVKVREHEPMLPEAIGREGHTLLRSGEAERSTAEMARLLLDHRGQIDAWRGALSYARKTRRLKSMLLLNEMLLGVEQNPMEQTALLIEQAEVRFRLEQPYGNLDQIRALLKKAKAKPNSRQCKRFDELTASIKRDALHGQGARRLHEPVDVVYTWVDAQDPVWLEKFEHFTGINMWQHGDDAQNWRRYEHFREIYLSLRTIDQYFPQARKIFIVTDNQTFDLSSLPESVRKKVQFVFHSEIIPAEEVELPTFVSDVIETFLDRIPGLSETFLYFNDDMFLGRPLEPWDIFDEQGRAVARLQTKEWPKDVAVWKQQSEAVVTDSHSARIPATVECYTRRLGDCPPYVENHQFRVRTRTQYRRMMEIFGEDLREGLFHSRLREKNSVRPCMLLDWIAVHEQTHAVRVDDRTVKTSWLSVHELDWEHVALLIESRPLAFCLNVTPERKERFEFLSRHFLDKEEGRVTHEVPLDPFYAACLSVAQGRNAAQAEPALLAPAAELVD